VLPLVVPSDRKDCLLTAFFPPDRALQPEGLHHSRGVAASGFPPLRKIPHCCLPQESGPCLSSSVAGRPLRPANYLRLGRPLPHQQANGTQALPSAVACMQRLPLVPFSEKKTTLSGISINKMLSRSAGLITYALLTRAPLYLPPEGDFLVRLACVRHAASVCSEPGSNSPLISVNKV